MDTPKGFANAEVVGNQIILEPYGGTSISKAVSGAIAFAGNDGKTHEVVLEFNGTRVPVEQNDTIRAVIERHREISEREHEAFLASPEGKEYQRQQKKYQEKQTTARRLVDELSGKSSFQFPKDMPSITGMGREVESEVRKQLVVGAQWLADNPTKTPFEPGHKSDRKEVETLMEQTDALGHSRMSFSMLMGALKTIAEQGFDGYVETIKQARARER
jgi:hypothetical protein